MNAIPVDLGQERFTVNSQLVNILGCADYEVCHSCSTGLSSHEGPTETPSTNGGGDGHRKLCKTGSELDPA